MYVPLWCVNGSIMQMIFTYIVLAVFIDQVQLRVHIESSKVKDREVNLFPSCTMFHILGSSKEDNP